MSGFRCRWHQCLRQGQVGEAPALPPGDEPGQGRAHEAPTVRASEPGQQTLLPKDAPGKTASWPPTYTGPVPGVPSPFPTCSNPCRCCYYKLARPLGEGHNEAKWTTGWKFFNGEYTWWHGEGEEKSHHGHQQHIDAWNGLASGALTQSDLPPQCECCYYRMMPVGPRTTNSIKAAPGWRCGEWSVKYGSFCWQWCSTNAPHLEGFRWNIPRSHLRGTYGDMLVPGDHDVPHRDFMRAWQRRDEDWEAEQSQSLRRQREAHFAEHEADAKQGRERNMHFAPGTNEPKGTRAAPAQQHQDIPEQQAHGDTPKEAREETKATSNVAPGGEDQAVGTKEVVNGAVAPKETREESKATSNVAHGGEDQAGGTKEVVNGAVALGAAANAAHRRAWLEEEIRRAEKTREQWIMRADTEDDQPEWYKAWKQNHPSPTWPPTTEYFIEQLNKMTDDDIEIMMAGEPRAKDVPLPRSSTWRRGTEEDDKTWLGMPSVAPRPCVEVD